MTEIEALILTKIDGVHARVNDVHKEVTELATITSGHAVKLEELLGNGQPGRLHKIEDDVKQHSKFMWTALGLLGAGSVTELVTHGLSALKLLFHHP